MSSVEMKSTSCSLDEKIIEARKRAQDFTVSLENARREEMESMKAIENERMKWAESYDGKMVMIEQLQRELAYTVEALHEEKSMDRSFRIHDSLGHSTSRDYSGMFDSSAVSGMNSFHSDAEYSTTHSHSIATEDIHDRHRSQLNHVKNQLPPPQPPVSQHYGQQKVIGNNDHFNVNKSLNLSAIETTISTDNQQHHIKCQHCGLHSLVDLTDTFNFYYKEGDNFISRENSTLKERITILLQRQNEAVEEMNKLKHKLDGTLAALHQSQEELKFRAEQIKRFDNERDSRNDIESDLRAQISKYESALETNKKTNSYLNRRLEEISEQLQLSDQKNCILMEENRKHVTEFEKFKGQLVLENRSSFELERNNIAVLDCSTQTWIEDKTQSAEVLTENAGSGDIEIVRDHQNHREMQLNEALQTQEELDVWLREMKRTVSYNDLRNVKQSSKYHDPNITGFDEPERTDKDLHNETETDSGRNFSVSEDVLNMRGSMSPPRAAWRHISESYDGTPRHESNYGLMVDDAQPHTRHLSSQQHSEEQQVVKPCDSDVNVSVVQSMEHVTQMQSETSSLLAHDDLHRQLPQNLNVSPTISVAVKKIVSGDAGAAALHENIERESALNLETQSDADGLSEHDTSNEIMLDSPHNDGKEDVTCSVKSSEILLNYQNFCNDEDFVDKIILPKPSVPIKVTKVKPKIPEKPSTSSQFAREHRGSARKPKVHDGRGYNGRLLSRGVVLPKDHAAPPIASRSQQSHKKKLNVTPPNSATPGQTAAQRRLASAVHKHINTNAKEAALVAKRAKRTIEKKPPSGRISSKKVKEVSKKVKKMKVVDRDSIDVTSVRSSLSLQSLSFDHHPFELHTVHTPSNSKKHKLVRRQLERNASKYPLQANIHSTVSSSVSTRAKGKTEGNAWR